MQEHQTVSIRQLSQDRAEQVANYRFLENEQVTHTELIRSLADACEQQVAEQHVLAISDSSEINLQAHAGRLKRQNLGVVGNNRDMGFFIHPTKRVKCRDGISVRSESCATVDARLRPCG